MDQDSFDFDLLQDLDLEIGDFGLPPVEELDPGEEPGPRPVPALADPHLPWLTPAIIAAMLAFGGLSLMILSSGGGEGAGGVAVAWLLGGAFGVLYVGLLWAGTLLFEHHRYGPGSR